MWPITQYTWYDFKLGTNEVIHLNMKCVVTIVKTHDIMLKTNKACIQLGLAMIIGFKRLIEVWMNSILLGCNVTMGMGETKGFGAMYGCWAYYILPNEQGQKICKYKSIGVSLATSSPLQWKVIGWSFLFHIDKF